MKKAINSSQLIHFGLLALLGIITLWFYWPVLANLAHHLSVNEDYSFGLLLPLVSGYIVYLKWPQLRRLPLRPSWLGLVVIAFGFCLYMVGELITDLYTPYLSTVVVLTGLILLLGGWSLVRALAFPLLLLVLMIPLPDFVIRQLTLPLQLLSSRLAAGFLQTIGIPLVRQGNVIDMGVRQLQVVAACSGLRYILALFALATIYCYFFQRRVWKTAILIIAVVPAAILANAVRVAAMGLVPSLQEEGFWHTFSGWLIFLFCFAFLGLLNWVLNYLQPPTSMSSANDGPTEKPSSPGSGKISAVPHLIAALILVLVAGPLALRLAQAPPTPLLQRFDNFPMQLDSWQGRHVYIEPEMVKATHCDAYVNAEYANPQSGSVSLWITYYESQKKAGSSVHSPFSCFRGGGWIVLDSQTLEIEPGKRVKYLLLDQSGNRLMVYYWFLQNGQWLTNEYLNKLMTGYNSLLNRRSDGTLVRLVTPAGQDVDAARKRLDAITRLLIPVLPQFIQH